MTKKSIYIYPEGVIIHPTRVIQKTINFIRVYRFFNAVMYYIASKEEK